MNSSARMAAACSMMLGLGFGLPCAYGIGYFVNHGEVWEFLGFPAYGHGPFERIGLSTSVPLLAGYLLVCVCEVVVGWMLWRGKRTGTMLGLALLPLETAYWIGFALPFGPPIGIARTVLSLQTGSRRKHPRNPSLFNI